MPKKRRKVYQRRPYLTKRENGIYYICHQVSGKQVRISTRTKHRLPAEAELDRYIASLDEGSSPSMRRVTLHQGIDDWFGNQPEPRHASGVVEYGLPRIPGGTPEAHGGCNS